MKITASMNTILKYGTIILISVIIGYAWAYQAYMPHIDRLTQTIQQLDQELAHTKMLTILNNQ